MSLTVKEMNDAIQKYCVDEHECVNCEIAHICFQLHGDFESDENLCKQAYDIVSKSESPEITTADLLALPTEKQDEVNHPAHYTVGGIECIDAMRAAFGDKELQIYCKIAAFKYIWRAEHKGNLTDISKAHWYLEKYLDLESESV